MKAAVWLLALAACRTEETLVTPDPHLERMLDQPKRTAYASAPDMRHGMVMQRPPEGTMTVDAIAGQPLVTTGVAGGRWASRIPVPVDRALVETGRDRFDTFCAACHGVLGDGDSVVAERMTLRRPRNLLDDDARAYPPGRVFQAIRSGYGLMPSYAVQLSVRESWGVVAYVRALQVARASRASDLPADVRADLMREAP
jgi:mono/diheme cytochrome c family protein